MTSRDDSLSSSQAVRLSTVPPWKLPTGLTDFEIMITGSDCDIVEVRTIFVKKNRKDGREC